jgi:hypothetical protein
MSLVAPIVGAVVSTGLNAAFGSSGSSGGSGNTSSSSSRTYQPFETTQNTRASGITRGAWDYAKSFYHPIEDRLMGMSSRIDEGQVFNHGQLAQQGVEAGYRGTLRDMLRQGSTLSVNQLQALDRNRQLDIATSRAAAQNNDRVSQYERNLNTLAALTSFGRTSLNQAIQAANSAAGMETQRNVSGGYTDKTTSKTTTKSSSGGGGSL